MCTHILSVYTQIYTRHRTIWIVCPLRPELIHTLKGAIGIAFLRYVLCSLRLGHQLSWGAASLLRFQDHPGCWEMERRRDFHRCRETHACPLLTPGMFEAHLGKTQTQLLGILKSHVYSLHFAGTSVLEYCTNALASDASLPLAKSQP